MTRGSRLLNENGSVVGLNTSDLMGAMGILILSASVLKPMGLDVFAVPIAAASLAALVPIRLRYRRKIIRDTIRYYLTRKVIYDPRNSKNHS